MRLSAEPDQSFAALLRHVRTVTLDALAHAGTPFDVVVRDVAPVTPAGRMPLFDIGVSWNALPHMARQSLAGCAVVPAGRGQVSATYDLLLIAGPDQAGIAGSLDYAADLFDAAAAETLVAQVQTILRQAAADPDILLCDFDLDGAPAPMPAAPVLIELNV
jgi:non-ribosomal peptide synthetase component F